MRIQYLKNTITLFAIISGLLLLSGCSNDVVRNDNKAIDDNFLQVPPGFPQVPVPADNPLTKEKVELGRKLFYEKKLSRNEDIACNTCHKRENAFCSAGIALNLGTGNEPLNRNVLPIFNAVYYKEHFWDGSGRVIEDMLYHDLFVTVIFNNDTNVILKRLEADPKYVDMFKKAFGSDARPHGYLIARAIACFVRTIISGNSRYDKYQRGDKTAMNENEIKGMELFNGKANCSKCHSGILFTDMKYHNTGTTSHYFDRGRYYVTLAHEDRGRFRTPTLRNIALTAPYIHNGDFYSIDELLRNYNAGGKPFINKDTLMKPLNLSQYEMQCIKAFLMSLTDEDFLKDTRFNKPD